MTETEIKKYLLKQKPEANLMHIRQGHAYYFTTIVHNYYEDSTMITKHKRIFFKIPVDDMGSTDFLPQMPGQSLIRWIYLPEN